MVPSFPPKKHGKQAKNMEKVSSVENMLYFFERERAEYFFYQVGKTLHRREKFGLPSENNTVIMKGPMALKQRKEA